MEVAQIVNEGQVEDNYFLTELDQARVSFVENLMKLKEGEDPTPQVENFLPLILPALKLGLKLIGRKKVVNFLAKLLGKLIQKFVGPKYATPLSRAIVDAGLKLVNLEATPEDETRAAMSAVASTIEETMRRVSSAPDYILDNQELLEGFALEAFEKAAASNLPQILPEEIYRMHPKLKEARKLRGIWIMMPKGMRKRYKKFSRRIPVRISPNKVANVETFEGISVEEFLVEQLNVAPGEEIEAFVHLYEAIPGTKLTDIARLEQNNSNNLVGHEQLHPLTREAATTLLGEPELGNDEDSQEINNPNSSQPGQRFYYMEIPGKKLLTIPGLKGKTKGRRSTRLKLYLDFPKKEIRIFQFLSEIRAQEIAVKLRQNSHTGVVITRLHAIIKRGLQNAMKGTYGSLKIIHETVLPDQWTSALRKLPVLALTRLTGKITEWVVKALSDHLKQKAVEFIQAADDTADGVTIKITIQNPPGFTEIHQLMKGKKLTLKNLKFSDGSPDVNIKILPGFNHE